MFSLKYKLLVVLIIMPLVALFIYLTLAINIFKEDKTAYLYATGLQTARSYGKQMESTFLSFKKMESILSINYSQTEELPKMAIKYFINSFTDPIRAVIYEVTPQTQSMTKIDEFKNESAYDFTQVIKDQEDKMRSELKDLTTLTQSSKIVDMDQEIFMLSGKLPLEKGGYFYAIYINSPSLFVNLKEKNLFKRIFLTKEGKAYGNDIDTDQSLVSSLKARIDQNQTQEGTLSMVFNDNDYIVSYYKIESLGHTFFTLLENSKAFEAVSILKTKSYLFFIGILVFSIILSILFSNGLTVSLRKLSEAAKELGQGNLNAQVNIRSKDEVGLLANTFNKMGGHIVSLLDELKKYNEQLEQMVEDRTRQLQEAMDLQKAMVDSLDQGFFIFDGNGIVLDIVSRAATDIFTKNPQGLKVSEVLHLPDSEIDSFDLLCKELIDESLPFNDLIAMAPQKFLTKDRHVLLNYTPIRDKNKKVKSVVLIATDKTQEIQALNKAQKQKQFVDMITSILTNKVHFFNFLAYAQKAMKTVTEFLNTDLNDQIINEMMRLFHTLKGNSASFNLTDIRDICHHLESLLKNPPKNTLELKEKVSELLTDLEQEFITFINTNKDITNIRSWDHLGKSYEVKYEDLKKFQRYLHPLPIEAKDYYFQRFISRDLGDIFSHVKQTVEELAISQGKKCRFIIETKGVRILEEPYIEVFDSLIHLFRNAVAHGMERPSERQALGKNETGIIKFSTGIDNQNLVLSLQDDGKGIDPEMIRQKLLKDRGEQALKMGQEELIYTIFEPQFSTQESADSVSGRGVGLDAVKDAVTKMNGKILVGTEKGKGTIFQIILPYYKEEA